MFKWDEADFIAALEVAPQIEQEYGFCHLFVVEKDGLRLEVSIFEDEEDIGFTLYLTGIEKHILFIRLTECQSARRVKDKSGEYLEFAASQISGSRRNEENFLPVGVRVAVNPHIKIELF